MSEDALRSSESVFDAVFTEEARNHFHHIHPRHSNVAVGLEMLRARWVMASSRTSR